MFDMEQYNQWPANHKNDKAPSEKIIKLGRKITDVAGHIMGGVKVEDPEYWAWRKSLPRRWQRSAYP